MALGAVYAGDLTEFPPRPGTLTLIRTGMGAAPLAIAFHVCPESEHYLLVAAEHVEQRGYDNSIPTGAQIRLVTSASSSTAPLTVNISESMRIGDGVVGEME